MADPLRIGLAGLGTVGKGVIELLAANGALVAKRGGRAVEVTAVSARDRSRDRGIDLSSYAWADDAADLAVRDDVDLVVELIGGSEGPALDLARDTLARGKGLVTANKAMIAIHGFELAQMAEANLAALRFEAAVAGGVPVVKGLREGASANAVRSLSGILNGTCNYILSTMESTGADFGETLAEAQELGFAEADPSFDIEGVDAAHKIAILAAIGFGTRPDFANVACEGIERVRADDIEQARSLGFVVRLVAMADCDTNGGGAPRLLQRVRPCLVPRGHPLSAVTGPTNAVVAEGDFAGRLLFQGAGAGDGPTASAVVADIVDIARGESGPAFSVPTDELAQLDAADAGHRTGRRYIRFTVSDRPGVLAEIAAAMRDGGVSIESLMQPGQGEEGADVLIAMVTHEGPEANVSEALRLLEGSDSLTSAPLVMPLLAN